MPGMVWAAPGERLAGVSVWRSLGLWGGRGAPRERAGAARDSFGDAGTAAFANWGSSPQIQQPVTAAFSPAHAQLTIPWNLPSSQH